MCLQRYFQVLTYLNHLKQIRSSGVYCTLDLKTRRPFDLKQGTTFSFTGEATRGNLSEETDPKLVAFAGYNNDDFGIIFTLLTMKVRLRTTETVQF